MLIQLEYYLLAKIKDLSVTGTDVIMVLFMVDSDSFIQTLKMKEFTSI